MDSNAAAWIKLEDAMGIGSRRQVHDARLLAMTGTIEQIETKIAYLEQANAELSDVVYRQQQELDALRVLIAETTARFMQAQASATSYTAEEERPPHY